MQTYKSEPKTVRYPNHVVYQMFSKFTNFDSLAEMNKLNNWKSTTDACQFNVENMGEIHLQMTERQENKILKMTNDNKIPFKFNFILQFSPVDANSTQIQFVLEAKINIFLRFFLKKTLQDFINSISEAVCQGINR